MASKLPGGTQIWGRYKYTLSQKRNMKNKLIKNDANLSKHYAYIYIPRNLYMVSKIRNRCVYSNRARAVLQQFKLARMTFKNFALSGFLNGVQKHSW